MKIVANSNKSRSRAGTSLVEVMIALTLFGVFTAGTCKLLVSHRKVLDSARDHYIAANLAKDRMELARTFEFDQVPELREQQLVVDESGIASPDGHYRRTTTVTAVQTNLLKFAVTVDIQNRKTLIFSPAEQSVSTYIAKHL
jgi:prepilin-type N-terminal cleavage/methylation domain-containing protein